MSFLRSIVTAPLSIFYKMGVMLRNWTYDSELRDSYVPDIPVVSVGNLTVGGTGKTPFTEYLIQALSSYYEIAVLSRGYKRKTHGFVLAKEDSTFRTIGDEPAQIKMKFPSIHVAVCEDRSEGIRKLKELFPSVGLIILDDAFQHRSVRPWIDIVLMDYNRPFYNDHMLPWGMLRDVPSQISRAEIVITSKCPEKLSAFDATTIKKYLNLYPYQKEFFTTIVYDAPRPLFPNECITRNEDGSYEQPGKESSVVVMAGIASPAPFINYVREKYSLVGRHILPDHHSFMVKDMIALQNILSTKPKDTLIFITEKDAVKLCISNKIPQNIRKRLYYIGISHKFLFSGEKQFIKLLLEYVRENRKDSFSASK